MCPEGCLPGGVHLPVPEADTPISCWDTHSSCGLKEWHTFVKILPCPSFAGTKYYFTNLTNLKDRIKGKPKCVSLVRSEPWDNLLPFPLVFLLHLRNSFAVILTVYICHIFLWLLKLNDLILIRWAATIWFEKCCWRGQMYLLEDHKVSGNFVKSTKILNKWSESNFNIMACNIFCPACVIQLTPKYNQNSRKLHFIRLLWIKKLKLYYSWTENWCFFPEQTQSQISIRLLVSPVTVQKFDSSKRPWPRL